jgi:hypothetical protein
VEKENASQSPSLSLYRDSSIDFESGGIKKEGPPEKREEIWRHIKGKIGRTNESMETEFVSETC